MGNGFKRFIDLSPLSMKSLNDQLEQLWLKVMGGISYRDLDSGTKRIIESKTDKKDVVSLIQQGKDEILLAVGQTGGDNIIKNGDWQFGKESWICSSANIENGYMRITTGHIMQQGIKVESGRTYTLGFEGYGNTTASVTVYGQAAGQDLGTSGTRLLTMNLATQGTAKKYRKSFTVPNGTVTCYVKIETTGTYRVRRIYIREGSNVDEYTSNPNEIIGSGISITDESVNISTSKFNLDIRDSNGNITSVLGTDGTGFNNLLCSNITVNDRDYLGLTGKHIYVNSSSGSDSNSGASTYYPFKTIARAFKEVPVHITNVCNIHLSGGTYYENISLNYGGSGLLNILGESAVLNGYINMQGSGYTLSVQSLKIFTNESYCFSGNGHLGFAHMKSCLLDCNGVNYSRGIYLNNGFRMYIEQCEINNCAYAINAKRGSYLDLVDCKGDKNEYSILISEMSIVNAEGTVPNGKTIYREDTGARIDGYIIAGIVGTDYTEPRDAVKTATFNTISRFTYNGKRMLNGVVRQGKGNGGFLVFNVNTIKSTLSGKVIKSVKVSIKRRNDDEYTHTATIKAFSHNVANYEGTFSYVDGYGDIGTIRRGEEVKVELPPAIISKIISGKVKGVLFYDNSASQNYYFELASSYIPYLEVQYV